MVWVQITVTGTSSLYIGAFYRPPNIDDPDYLNHLDTCLSRIPTTAHIWLGGDFNLGDINWEDNSVKEHASKPTLSRQLINIANDRFLEQQVTEPTRTTEHSSNTLDLFFTNNSSLINNTEVIPGISDHHAVYVEASLKPLKTTTPSRKVYCYDKANYMAMNEDLHKLHTEMKSMPNSTIDTLWTKFKDNLILLMDKHIPSKLLKNQKTKKPWIDRKVKSAIKRRTKLYRRMKKTKSGADIRKYKVCKSHVQKLERQNYHQYINNLIEVQDPNDDKQLKQKRFWNYIKSLRKDNSGIAPLKDNGRLFNLPKDKADILNKQYMSVFTQEDGNDVPSPTGTPYPDMDTIHIEEAGVRKLLQNLNPRKASGPDNISARILKDCAENLVPHPYTDI
ncbi:uncharacterized protein LOC127865168 [Dreissena polymorpha]|uniref:uncharacterized protein LOC127865168 n=1 Tax=Dreissena polymorpha TaxID=45954 RepID=UPI00226525A6|nr:uncharacterized protein LOC127865168 [Dreissena polymorpha]